MSSSPTPADDPRPGAGERLARAGERLQEARQAAEEVAAADDVHTPQTDRGHAGAFEPSGDDADAGKDPQDEPS